MRGPPSRARLSQRLTDFWQISFPEPFWRFTLEDLDSVIAEIGSKPEQDDKLVALSVAFKLYVQNDRPRRWRERLKDSVNGNPELSDQLNNFLKPPAQSEEARTWRKDAATWKRRSAERQKNAQRQPASP